VVERGRAADAHGQRQEAVLRGTEGQRVLLEEVLAELVGRRQLDGVVTAEAGRAQLGGRLLGGGDEALHRDVAQRVRPERRGDLVGAQPVRDELGTRREVDAVEARPLHGRGADAHVHLGGARLADHPDEGALRVPADDRVVHHDEPLAADHLAQGVQL